MDELLSRQAPCSPSAEQAVIGSMLIDPECIPEVVERLRGAEFYIRQNREIYDTVYAMFSYSQTIDPVTVLEQMKVRGVYRDESRDYLAELMSITPTAANVGEYVTIVKDRALQRSLASAADEITKLVYDGSGEAENMLEAAERMIYALRQGRNVGGLLPLRGLVKSVYDDLSEISAGGARIPGLPTGLPDLDKHILGLNKGELILIAARPGMGKTSIALNVATYVAKKCRGTVAVFSLEMSREQLVGRLLSSEALVPSQKLLTGDLSREEWKRIAAAAQSLSATDMRIDDNSLLTVADINAQCRRISDLSLVVIDYLQLMQSAGGANERRNENRQQVVSDISRMMKIMAKELNVPVLCLSQLSRANESRPNKRPVLSDLRESGAIEQDADVVIGLYRDGYYNEKSDNPNLAEAIILKNRKGMTGTVELTWLPEYTSFASYDMRHGDDY